MHPDAPAPIGLPCPPWLPRTIKTIKKTTYLFFFISRWHGHLQEHKLGQPRREPLHHRVGAGLVQAGRRASASECPGNAKIEKTQQINGFNGFNGPWQPLGG